MRLNAVSAFANCGRAVAHVRGSMCHVRIAAVIARLFDDLSAGEQHGRHVDPLRLGRLEVDDQFKFRRLRNRMSCR